MRVGSGGRGVVEGAESRDRGRGRGKCWGWLVGWGDGGRGLGWCDRGNVEIGMGD